MKPLRYLKANNLPPRINLGVIVLYWLLLDRIAAPAWVYGAVFTWLGVVCLGGVIDLWRGEAVDLLKNGTQP